MLYIVRVFEDGQIYEYEYGTLEHAQAHMNAETAHAELYVYMNGREEYVDSVN